MNHHPVSLKTRAKVSSCNLRETKLSVSFSIELSEEVTRDRACSVLVNSRLNVILSPEDPDQATFVDEGAIKGVADCYRLSVGRNNATGQLSFRADAVDLKVLKVLKVLAGREVWLVVEKTGDASSAKGKDGSTSVAPEQGEIFGDADPHGEGE